MKRYISLFLLLMLPCWMAFGADTKVTALTENSDPVGTDLLYMVDDPGGTPLSQKITLANIAANMPDITVLGSDLTIDSAGVKLTGDGDGAVTILGLGNGSDEDLTLNLDDVSNEVTVSSSTGVTVVDLEGAIDLEVSGADVTIAEAGVKLTGSNGSVTLLGLGDGTDEDLKIDLNAANVATLTSTTSVDNIVGVASYSLGAAGVKLTGDADGAVTLLGLGDGSDEDLTINLDDVSNEVTLSTSTGATLVDLDGALDLEVSGNDLTLGETGIKFTSDGDGAVTLLGLSAGYDEDLTINLDDTENTAVLSSSTGVVSLSTGAIALTNTSSVTTPGAILTPTAIASLGAATAGKMVMTSDSGNGTDCTTAGGAKQNLCIGDGSAFVLVKAVKA